MPGCKGTALIYFLVSVDVGNPININLSTQGKQWSSGIGFLTGQVPYVCPLWVSYVTCSYPIRLTQWI